MHKPGSETMQFELMSSNHGYGEHCFVDFGKRMQMEQIMYNNCKLNARRLKISL